MLSIAPHAKHIKALRAATDLLMVTATPVERDAVLHRLHPLPGKTATLRITVGPSTYYFGVLGTHCVALTMCQMGSISSGASRATVAEACAMWCPRAVVMVGIAFGKDSTRQKFGDVLVSSQIVSYEEQRVGTKHQFRGPVPEASRTLVDRFRNVVGWGFARSDATTCTYAVGPILSGEKLIASTAFKNKLLRRFPDAIGGEMEGRGLYAAAHEAKVDWILVKGICDWGDESKQDAAQPLAAAAAVDLVWAALSDPGALDGLPKPTADTDRTTQSTTKRARSDSRKKAHPLPERSVSATSITKSIVVTGDRNRVVLRGKP